MSSTKERNLYYDLLRFAAMLMIIAGHGMGSVIDAPIDSVQWGVFTQWFLRVMDSLLHLAIPVFFMLSGLFLLNKPVDNLKKWYAHRISRILIPYLVFGLGYAVYFAGIENHNPAGIPLYYFKGILCGELHPILWFVNAILGLYLVTPFLAKLFAALSDHELLIFYSICFGLMAMSDILGLFGWHFGIDEYVFGVEQTMSFITGYCIKRLLESYKCTRIRRFRFLLIVVFFLLRLLVSDLSIFHLLIVGLLALPTELHLPKALGRCISFNCSHSYSIYLVHPAVISLLLKLNSHWGNSAVCQVILFALCIWLLSLLIVILPDYCIDKFTKRLLKNL